MELQIQDLVNSIKQDGIAEAEKKRDEILLQAEKEAKEKIAEATATSLEIVNKAKKEASLIEQSGVANIQQAARDLILSLKKSILDHYSVLLNSKLSATLKGEVLVSLIVSVVKSGLIDPKKSVVEVDSKSLNLLVENLTSELAKEIKEGLEIRPVEKASSTFKLSSKDGSFFYDFSDQEIVNLLAPFLNSSIHQILEQATKAK